MKKQDGKTKWRVISSHLNWQNYKAEVYAMYHDKNMSGSEISEYIEQNIPKHLHITITPRSIQRTVVNYGHAIGIMKPTRNPKNSFNLAIKRGRVKWAYKDKKYVRHQINPKLRYNILTRDNFACVKCGNTAKEALLEVDHILAICKGGLTIPDNLQTLCHHCNKGKQLAEKEV